MHRFKMITIRFFMFILFISAVSTTFYSISGVEAKSVSNSIRENIKGDYGRSYINHTLKSFNLDILPFQLAGKITDSQSSVSSATSTNVPALEDAFDWSKYPTKKVVATGYTAGYESTGKNANHPEFGITYSGVMVKRDLYSTVAADLTVFPIGTILFIPGYGYGVVADKGGAIKGNRVDLYYETVDDVYNRWGKKEIDVYVVEMGNGTLTENDLILLNEAESMQVFRQQYINPEGK